MTVEQNPLSNELIDTLEQPVKCFSHATGLCSLRIELSIQILEQM